MSLPMTYLNVHVCAIYGQFRICKEHVAAFMNVTSAKAWPAKASNRVSITLCALFPLAAPATSSLKHFSNKNHVLEIMYVNTKSGQRLPWHPRITLS
jgi:hypothetical protein